MEKFILTQKNNIWFGSYPRLTAAGFTNACSCRVHGESALIHGLFNLALHVGDEKELVLANRRKFAAALGVNPKRFTTCAQVHGSKICVVTEPLVGAGALDYATTVASTDSLITNLEDVPLMLFYADCVPVLLADTVTGAIGLAHAGWRGTVAGIAAETVAAMKKNFGSSGKNIIAAIGPSIGGCCYEVDDKVRVQADDWQEFFNPVPGIEGKYLFDLWGCNRRQLELAGIPYQNIISPGICTAHNSELFCSYRAEHGKTGRMGVCICRKSNKG